MRRRERPMDPEVVHGLRELEAALAAEPAADPDLALLVADVRAARPEPDPTFLAALDAKVHAGFPREHGAAGAPARAPWHARLRRPQVLVPGVGGALAAVLLALVAAGGSHDHGSSSSSPGAAAPTIARQDDSAATSGGGASAESAAPTAKTAPGGATSLAAPAPSAPRRVERAVQLTLTPAPADVQTVADGVVRETQAAGGYVARSSVSTADGGGSAQFTLRIPTASLDDALARLSKLAHVGSLTQHARDITATFTSAAERLSDARAERRALLQALGRASTDRQVASLKARLAENRAEITRRQAALAAVARRANLATVQVAVEGTGKPKQGGGAWTPGDALHDAGRVLEVAGGVALVAGAVLAPLAVLAALAAALARTARRRRRETALDQLV
jgi:hypothetical protein